MSSKKILITGVSGMLGTDLCDSLCKHFEVSGTDIRPAVFPSPKVPHYTVDLTDRPAVMKLFKEEKPWAVFHAAAMTNVDRCELDRDSAYRANVVATQHVTDAANESGTRVVFFSTDYVFDGKKGGEYSEEEAPHPLNYYGETKRLAEQYVMSTADHFVIFRISWLFGTHGPSFPRTILEKAGGVGFFEVVHDQVGRPTSTRDLATALRELFVKNRESDRITGRQIFHLANGGYCSWADYAEWILIQSRGAQPSVKKIPTPPGHRPAERPKFSVLSVEKIKKQLGISLRPWQEAVKDFVTEFESKKGSECETMPNL